MPFFLSLRKLALIFFLAWMIEAFHSRIPVHLILKIASHIWSYWVLEYPFMVAVIVKDFNGIPCLAGANQLHCAIELLLRNGSGPLLPLVTSLWQYD